MANQNKLSDILVIVATLVGSFAALISATTDVLDRLDSRQSPSLPPSIAKQSPPLLPSQATADSTVPPVQSGPAFVAAQSNQTISDSTVPPTNFVPVFVPVPTPQSNP